MLMNVPAAHAEMVLLALMVSTATVAFVHKDSLELLVISVSDMSFGSGTGCSGSLSEGSYSIPTLGLSSQILKSNQCVASNRMLQLALSIDYHEKSTKQQYVVQHSRI